MNAITREDGSISAAASARLGAYTSEREVVAIAIGHPESLDQMSDLDGSDFEEPMHKATFKVIRDLHRANQPIDLAVIADHLVANLMQPQQATIEGLMTIIREATAAPEMLPFHLRMVQNTAYNRRLKARAYALYKSIGSDNEDPQELLELYDFEDRQAVAVESLSVIEQFTLADLREAFPRLNPAIIDGLLREGETANIIAGTKVGKSWLAYGLALSVASGQDWLGRFQTTPGKVLLIDNELHPPTIAGRIPAVAAAMGLDLEEVAEQIVIWPLRGKLRDLEQLGIEFAKVKQGEYKLTILDAWYRAIPPEVSENDNASIAKLYNIIDGHAARLGCAFACIHHTSKGIQSDKKVTDVGAGAGSQSRAADCHLVLREHEEEGLVVLDAAVRSFPPVSPIVLRWEFPVWVPDEDADPSALKGKKTRGEERQEDKDAKGQGIVLDALSEPLSRTALRTKTGFGRDKLDRLVAKLMRGGFVEETTIEVRGKECDGVRKTLKARD